MSIYVEILVRAPMDALWNHTQTPSLHEQWISAFHGSRPNRISAESNLVGLDYFSVTEELQRALLFEHHHPVGPQWGRRCNLRHPDGAKHRDRNKSPHAHVAIIGGTIR